MFKKILFFALLISFFSVSFCFALEANDWLPEMTGWWGSFVNWINGDFIPWIENNLGEQSREEFQKELAEALADVPVAVRNSWDFIKDLFK